MVGAILANHQRGDLIKVPGIGELLEVTPSPLHASLMYKSIDMFLD
jgi:hypothetical protein